MTSDVLKSRKKLGKCTIKKTYFFEIFFVLCSYVQMSHKVPMGEKLLSSSVKTSFKNAFLHFLI
jgi:hypothetical protein